MKNIFLLIALALASSAYGATCTSTTRNNYVTNQVLTSTALNADFNQLVTKANDFDGGCVTDGTLESAALNSSQFAPLLKGVKEGCLVTQSDSNTISVNKCLIAVGGALIEKTTATTATWGCSGCSAESASTFYYIYAKATTPLTLEILTTAPDADGYSGTSRVLARFYNNASSNIGQYSVEQWVVNRFIMRRLQGESQFKGTTACDWARASTTIGPFGADADCPGPTINFSATGDWLTTDADLPRQTVNNLPAGTYKAKFIFIVGMSASAQSAYAINDGTSTCTAVSGNTDTVTNQVSVECTFVYTSSGNRVFELYTGSSSSTVNLNNSTTSPATTGTKFFLEYVGD